MNQSVPEDYTPKLCPLTATGYIQFDICMEYPICHGVLEIGHKK